MQKYLYYKQTTLSVHFLDFYVFKLAVNTVAPAVQNIYCNSYNISTDLNRHTQIVGFQQARGESLHP